MSVEQLLFVVLFILVPLVRTLMERRNKRREAESEEGFETMSDTAPFETPASFEPPEWPVPTPPAPRPAPLVVPSPPPAARVLSPAVTATLRPVPAPARSLRTARARNLAAVPRNREELRRALVLVEVLGPPRALDPKAR